MSAGLAVEVVYATPTEQQVVTLSLPPGSSVAAAIQASGLLQRYPQLDPAQTPVGIHGRRVEPGTPLRPGDRVELYRPLTADPKSARRSRVQAARARRNSRPKTSESAGN